MTDIRMVDIPAQRVHGNALPDGLDKFGRLVDAINIFHEAASVAMGIDHFAQLDSSLCDAYRRGPVSRHSEVK
jgi:hypothetical protein